MSRFVFELAGPGDDAALRRRMAADPIQGRISVSFRREPSYFTGCGVQGGQAQIIKCVDRRTGQLVGLGARLSLQAHVNGRPMRIGYLGDLRGSREHRGGTLLGRGYRFLRELHEQDPLPLYFSLILEGNESAIRCLSGARAGLPRYHDHGRILTPAIHLDLPRPRRRVPGLRLEQARAEQLPEIVRFLGREYARKQLAPVYDCADFGSPRLYGLKVEDITLALRDGRIVGTLASWDQRGFRQTHIERYSPALALLRPLYNLIARLAPLKPLPPAGGIIPYVYLALAAVEDDRADIFRALLAQVHARHRRGPWHYCIAGLHEDSPLAAVLRRYRRIRAAGRLFVIHYPEYEALYRGLDARTPHIEIAAV